MALRMDYTDVTGTDHPNSHWRIVQLNLGVSDNTGNVVFYGYHDLASWQAGKQPLAGAVKSYSIAADSFAALYDQPVSVSTVTNKALTNNVATLTTFSPHGFQQGDTVVVSGVDSTFNGTFVTTAVTSTTFSYAVTASNVVSVSASGSACLCVGDTLKTIIYGFVETLKDTPDPNNPGQLVSFFATAVSDPEA